MSNVSSVYIPDNVGSGTNVESILLGSMMNNGGGFGSMNSPFWAIILLAFLRNLGGFGVNENNSQLSQIQDTLNTNQGNQLIMSAIQGNANSIKELASAIGCNHNAVTAAVNGVQSAICGVGNQLGMSSAQVINSIQSGNTAIANQIAQCCCDSKLLTQQQGYESRINNIEQTNTIIKGFGDIMTATQSQTSALAANNDANTRAVLGKLDQIEDDRKNREIASLTAALTAANSRAERQSELAPIYQQLSDIKCRQPESITIPYSPVTAVPSCVAWNAALYGGGYQFAAQRGNVFS